MILLLGQGYIGSAFASELEKRGTQFFTAARARHNYTDPEDLLLLLRKVEPSLVINAAGYTGKPNVDACELHRAECLTGNLIFPAMLANVCKAQGVPFGHVSTGCIYNGHPPDGFRETDPPNFCFTSPPCSFYSGTKALAEETLKEHQCYIWRMRMPFDHIPNPKNYLTKLLTYPKLYNNTNSLSHRSQCVAACIDMWMEKVPYGIYNVVNPGAMTTAYAASFFSTLMGRDFTFFKNDREFYEVARTPRSNCLLSTDKLSGLGIHLPDIHESMLESVSAYAHHIKKPQAA